MIYQKETGAMKFGKGQKVGDDKAAGVDE